MKRKIILSLWSFGVLIAAAAARFSAIDIGVTPEHNEQRVVRGVMHAHTDLSHDGKQSLTELTRDAKRAGLDFVVVSDHNATLPAPLYSAEGVLVVPATELSMSMGHVLALGMGEAAVSGAKAKLEDLALADVRRESALVIAAHPDSKKHGIEDAVLPLFSGYELLSSSSDFYALLRSPRLLWLFGVPISARAAFSALYPARARGAARYDALPGQPLLTCGADDHGRIFAPERLLTYVTYLPTFIPERDAAADSKTLVDHLIARESYCALGLFGDASPLSVTVRGAGHFATIGATVSAPAILRVRWQGALPPGHKLYIYKDGESIEATGDAAIERELVQPGRYRIELGRDVPTFWFGTRHLRWIYTNPIVITPSAA